MTLRWLLFPRTGPQGKSHLFSKHALPSGYFESLCGRIRMDTLKGGVPSDKVRCSMCLKRNFLRMKRRDA